MKLTLELVPESAFNLNLRHYLPKEGWDHIRRIVYRENNYCCTICGVRCNPPSAHEVWDYINKDGVGTIQLRDVVCLCNNCHMLKHWGFAQILADQGRLDLDELRQHFCAVNECTLADFDAHVAAEFALWSQRSQVSWTLNLNGLFGIYEITEPLLGTAEID